MRIDKKISSLEKSMEERERQIETTVKHSEGEFKKVMDDIRSSQKYTLRSELNVKPSGQQWK